MAGLAAAIACLGILGAFGAVTAYHLGLVKLRLAEAQLGKNLLM
jgi:hypothetical protein